MPQPSELLGSELWPAPGFAARGVLSTSAGLASISLSGAKDARGVVVLAAEGLPLLRGLTQHAVRQGIGVLAVVGLPGPEGEVILRAALAWARKRGATRLALAVHGPWTDAALLAAPGAIEVCALIDPHASQTDPTRLRGIPLWIASGTDAAPCARTIHARAQHPRALVELHNVPRLENAVNDLASDLVPVLRHGLDGA
jgi:hypothetical protein